MQDLSKKEVTAAGGYVVREGAEAPEILMIFRRGVWDLPKGKRDLSESIEACALREVREEVGVKELAIEKPIGTTVHNYERGGVQHVKTTHWFLMRTPENTFTPQREEDIHEIQWMPWPQAIRCVGYASLQEHMKKYYKGLSTF